MLYNLFENRDFVSVFAVALLAEGVDRNFYNPALVTSDFHESQIFVIEEGGHRFFTERSTR